MTKYTKIIAAATAAAAILTSTGVAFAQTPPQGGDSQQHGPGMMGRPGFVGRFDPHGSSSPMTGQGSQGKGRGQRGGQDMRGVPGTVTQIDSGDFLMTTPGFGKGMSTTTFTVTVTGATKFVKGGEMGQGGQGGEGDWQGSTSPMMGQGGTGQRGPGMMGSTTGTMPQLQTASFSDLTVGAHVVVMGKVATSTKTIAADRVVIGGGMGPRHDGQNGQGTQDGQGQQGNQHGGFFGFLRSLFGSHSTSGGSVGGGAGTQVETGGGPGAAGSPDFVGGVLNALFGWLH